MPTTKQENKSTPKQIAKTIKSQIKSVHGNATINVPKAVELRLKGLSYRDIAKQINATESGTRRAILRYLPNIDDLQVYKDHRADLFACKQAELLFSVTPDDIKSMAAGSRITGAAILYDKERLERGQATDHVAYVDLVAQDVANDSKIKEIQAKIDRLMAVEGNEG